MSVFSDRVKAKIELVGQTLSFTKLAGSTSGQPFARKGIVNALDRSTARVYLDDAELMGVVYPALLVMMAGDSTVIVDDTFVRDGITYTVWKVFKNRVANVVTEITVIASE